jgi:hypothetical protein
MASLIVEHAGKRKSVPLSGKVWIGRDAECQIIINHPIVSRQHAWVESAGHEAALVNDNNSRNGTLIAGEKLSQPRELHDGDIFQIGPATIAFHSEDAQLEIEAPSVDAADVSGIIFQCDCGARLWAPRGASGSTTICPKCRKSVKAPGELPPPPTRHQICGVCQWKIESTEQMTACPACGVCYHVNCWNDNKGCAAYGCSQVNVMGTERREGAPTDAAPIFDASLSDTAESDEPSTIEGPLLAASVIGTLLGIIAFGVPAFLAAGLAIWYLLMSPHRRRHLLMVAAIIGVLGAVGGLLASMYWWMQLAPRDLLGI